MSADRGLLQLFVYGTLKRGYENHRKFCDGYLEVKPAQVHGRLYLLVDRGYPILDVAPGQIAMHGSASIASDLRLSEEIAATKRHNHAIPGIDELIEGEILTFSDAVPRLRAFDELESFYPDGGGEYLRVLIWTAPPDPQLVWTYIAPKDLHTRKLERLERRWP